MTLSARSRGSIHASEHGSMLPLFGGLMFVSFAMISLVVELAMLGGAYRNTAGAADAASEAAASMVATGAIYDGETTVNPAAAEATAASVAGSLASVDATVTVAAAAAQVCVTVSDSYRTRTLTFIGVSTIDISVTSCAEPRTG